MNVAPAARLLFWSEKTTEPNQTPLNLVACGGVCC